MTVRDFPPGMEKAHVCEACYAPCRLVFLADHGALPIPERLADRQLATAASAVVRCVEKEDRLR